MRFFCKPCEWFRFNQRLHFLLSFLSKNMKTKNDGTEWTILAFMIHLVAMHLSQHPCVPVQYCYIRRHCYANWSQWLIVLATWLTLYCLTWLTWLIWLTWLTWLTHNLINPSYCFWLQISDCRIEGKIFARDWFLVVCDRGIVQ